MNLMKILVIEDCAKAEYLALNHELSQFETYNAYSKLIFVKSNLRYTSGTFKIGN